MEIVQGVELELLVRENLIARRKKLGLTQADLAERLGVRQPYVSALESGTRKPTLDTIARLAEALNTTPDALLSRNIFSSKGS